MCSSRVGECDYAEEFAAPLPCSVFLALMGLPLEDLSDFLRLKEVILRGSSGDYMNQNDPLRQQAQVEATERFQRLIEARRHSPQDDLLTTIIETEVEGQVLSDAELIGICNLLLIAGLDTVTDSLTCFYAFLGRNPDYRRRLVGDSTAIDAAVEEMLRYQSPVPFVLGGRRGHRPWRLSDCCGRHRHVVAGSANSDERAIERADEVDFDRTTNRHLAFGGGVHRCLGSHLARLELRVSLREWIGDSGVPHSRGGGA